MAHVHDLVVSPAARGLVGSVPVAGDEHIGSLALICGALADGTSRVRRVASGRDSTALLQALTSLGISVSRPEPGTVELQGGGLEGLRPAGKSVDCDESSRAMALLASVLVATPFATTLSGGPRLLEADFAPLAAALRGRGASIEGVLSPDRVGRTMPPLVVGPLSPRRRLSEVEQELAPGMGRVKEALLLSGLFADGSTYVRENIVSPDHLERLLQALDVPVATAGPIVELEIDAWGGRLTPFAADVPGDFSFAAVLLAAAALVPESRICARGTGLNPTRTGALEALRLMGGAVEVAVHRSVLGEPEGIACASHAPLRAAVLGGEMLLRAATETPVLAALAVRARGESELFVAESGGIERVLRAFGVETARTAEGLAIAGVPDRPIAAGDVDVSNDPGLATLGILLGLVAEGPSRVRGADAVAGRFPKLVGTLRALGADVRVEQRTV